MLCVPLAPAPAARLNGWGRPAEARSSPAYERSPQPSSADGPSSRAVPATNGYHSCSSTSCEENPGDSHAERSFDQRFAEPRRTSPRPHAATHRRAIRADRDPVRLRGGIPRVDSRGDPAGARLHRRALARRRMREHHRPRDRRRPRPSSSARCPHPTARPRCCSTATTTSCPPATSPCGTRRPSRRRCATERSTAAARETRSRTSSRSSARSVRGMAARRWA